MPARPAPTRRSGPAARATRAERPGLREREKERTRRELREGAGPRTGGPRPDRADLLPAALGLSSRLGATSR